ncbi:MAG: hypothetical protein FJ125_08935 [Deltaproteobacteria bacterium]|nr:hypothetical protein [Deltaproteobacteria bacterium]
MVEPEPGEGLVQRRTGLGQVCGNDNGNVNVNVNVNDIGMFFGVGLGLGLDERAGPSARGFCTALQPFAAPGQP